MIERERYGRRETDVAMVEFLEQLAGGERLQLLHIRAKAQALLLQLEATAAAKRSEPE